MKKQYFTIEYNADKPIFPINNFRFVVNSEYADENLKTLKAYLDILLGALVFVPFDIDTISKDTAKCKRTHKHIAFYFKAYSGIIDSRIKKELSDYQSKQRNNP